MAKRVWIKVLEGCAGPGGNLPGGEVVERELNDFVQEAIDLGRAEIVDGPEGDAKPAKKKTRRKKKA